MRNHRAETPQHQPSHRAEVSNVRLATVWGGALTILAAGVYVSIEHPDLAGDPHPHTTCNYQTFDPIVPQQDKNRQLVSRVLKLRPSEHPKIAWFPAMCRSTLSRPELAEGIVQSPDVLRNEDLYVSFESCALYGVQQQLMAEVGYKDKFAVLACVVKPDIVQI